MNEIYTIGHSNHQSEYFIGLLKQHGIEVVCDVRSQPFSKYNPQFNQSAISDELRKNGIKYVFMGTQLGVRSGDPENYRDGKVCYDLLAVSPEFRSGLARLRTGSESYRIALMCTEKDPINCHRAILVSRHLKALNLNIGHILASGGLESHYMLEERLLDMYNYANDDLFMGRTEKLEVVYGLHSEKIAYEISGDNDKDE